VELYGRVRYAVQIEGLSHREAARRFGIDPRTAVQHGVQTIDHAQLADICASVNRSVHQMRH